MTVIMKKLALLWIFLGVLGNGLAANELPNEFPNEFHPEFPLLDADGNTVVSSGKPLSTMVTCGECHDTAFIEQSSDHADAGAGMLGKGGPLQTWEAGPGYYGGWDPLRYAASPLDAEGEIDLVEWLKRHGARHVGGGPVGSLVELNCLMCHSDLGEDSKARDARNSALAGGDFAWANSAQLTQRDVLVRSDGQWQWNSAKFLPDGRLQGGLLDIRKPRDENCGQCHGQVSNRLDAPLTIAPDLSDRSLSERTGQIFSPQKLFNSGLNLADKESLAHAFDVHSDRVLGCVNCHYSLNNPVYFQQREESRPDHLVFDPRRLTSADYLARPLHQFAKGKSNLGLAASGSENSLRRCESCHQAGQVHDWLPYRERHFASLACESCHIPKLYGPALQTLDWTMLDSQGQALRQYRNIEGDPSTADSLISGYRPAMLVRENVGGMQKLAPHNLVSSWYWLAGTPAQPVSRAQLEAALFDGEDYHPQILQALDRDRDGELAGDELWLDSESRLYAVQQRLLSSGLEQVRLSGEIIPFAISHNVVNGRWATRDCASCHGRDSVLAMPVPLSAYLPGDSLPTSFIEAGLGTNGRISRLEDGAVSYAPDSRASGYYIIGLHGVRWIDLAGLAMFLGVALGVAVHATARYIARRRRLAAGGRRRKRVYMYDAYERLWHWLQASVILLLLATGLIIHKPHLFGIFSFGYIVQVHNVLGFILLINAAMALFYNLASGEIRQYLPEPRGFVGRSIAQALYYTRGIFEGRPHPLEKTKERKLNPLQQITYLGVLNVLLPAQVITGLMIWGMQKWPVLAASLGGLPILAPLHTLLAWTFAAFIVMHVYLTTAAGDTPGAGIRSMVSGWEDVEDHVADHVSRES
jgi:thiosulfate reductase cytochrome b subunit/cytochrome c553